MLRLYSSYRCSAAYRCRIALDLKGLAHETALPRLVASDEACRALPAFAGAAPEARPDAA